mmetsp:Transcript_3636/g.4497  ORF Transcript_3636/g.4497 Transcript_3636/m.4497 type:complete len:102 (-) Transcript_3636:124-429(-)
MVAKAKDDGIRMNCCSGRRTVALEFGCYFFQNMIMIRNSALDTRKAFFRSRRVNLWFVACFEVTAYHSKEHIMSCTNTHAQTLSPACHSSLKNLISNPSQI